MQGPIDAFKAVWRDAKSSGSLKHRNAVCVSTIDAEGYPSSRFVDLKAAEETGFVFCSHLDSNKALEIARNSKAGMTVWWEHVGTQIRIKGQCDPISEPEAEAHWSTRPRDAQIATVTFRQSQQVAGLESLEAQYFRAIAEHDGKPIARPRNWGGFRLRAQHVEFLEFKESRLHLRTAYALVDGRWHRSFLLP